MSRDNSTSYCQITETEESDLTHVIEFNNLTKGTKHMYGSGHKRYWNETEVSIIRGLYLYLDVRFVFPNFDNILNFCLL